jgi:hypothetical protein
MKNPQRKRQTAAEFLKELEADPADREMRERQERLGREIDERVRVSEANAF